MKRSIVALLVLAAPVAACGSRTASPSPATAQPAVPSPAPQPSSSAPAGSGIRPIVFDTDMGMDDLLALYMILRDPTLDVRAIAIDGTGLVHCGPGSATCAGSWARSTASTSRSAAAARSRAQTAGHSRTSGVPRATTCTASSSRPWSLKFPPDAVTILHDALAASREPVTLLAVGTWTNLQDLFAAHSDDLAQVAGIHTMAGTIDDPGNIEFDGTTPPTRSSGTSAPTPTRSPP